MASQRVLWASLLLAFAGQTALAARINCPPGDNATIQACLDQAAAGDTIVFSGSYQIDPAQNLVSIVNKSHLRLVGDEDNPPLFTCQVGPDGRPSTPADTRLNSGFFVLAGSAEESGLVVSGLVFDGLHFSDCVASIVLSATDGGRYADIRIRNVSITNGIVAVSIAALADGLDIRGCSIERSDAGILVDTPIGLGHSTRVVIAGNDVAGLADDQPALATASGILLQRGDGRVHGNTVAGYSRFVVRPGLGIIVLDDTAGGANDVSVYDNLVRSSTIGIALNGRARATGRVFSNVIENSPAFGINLRFGANGWRVGPNDISGSGVGDVNLVPKPPLLPPLPAVSDPFGTQGNTVYLRPGQTYFDPGGLNTIVVRDE